MFCQYKNALGKVGKGLHSLRVMNIAVVDVLFTIIGAFMLYLIFPQYSYFLILGGLFLLGIILHRVFCVRTTVDKFLFNN